ncbi:hypothetical protein [Streptomyces mexicanus]|uniref:hypothetical protein n=1 Tax=Streptomyces mexicanus TaxID=178566 RepID=UPI0036562EBE
MPWWRRRRGSAPAPHGQHDLAFALTPTEFRTLIRVIRHARERLETEADTDPETLRNASGAELLPLVRSRARAALASGADGVPMLVSEIRHVEAAVVNLASYGGHETVLCEGHALLDRLAAHARQARRGRSVDGVLTLPPSSPQTPCG